jgi:tetratricopeptide (TPR) repeat protein
LYEELLREQPRNAAWIGGLAGTLHNRAVVLSRNARTHPEAITVFRESNRLRQQLADAQPGNVDRQANLAVSLHSLGTALGSSQESEALEAFRQALAIRERLAADHPSTRRFQHDLASSCIDLGVCHSRVGRKEKALENYQRAREVQDRLLRQDRHSPGLRQELAQTWYHIGTISGALNRRADENAAFGKARELQQALVDADPKRLDYRCDLAKTLNNLAWNWLALGKPTEARDAARQAIEHSRLTLDRAPQVTDYRKTLTANWGTLGEVERRLGHTRAAAAALGAIPELWPDDPRELYQTATNLARVATSAGNDADGRQHCLDRAVDLLRRALDRGWSDTRRLQQDHSLDPLRDREDFRALVEKWTRKDKSRISAAGK